MRSLATATIMGLVACGMPEPRFLVTGLETLCENAAACEGTFDASTCYDHLRETDHSSCDYDPAAARQCVKGAEDAKCKLDDELGSSTWVFPEECDLVWDCATLTLAY